MPQEQHIRSEAVQDILTRVPHWMIRQGNTLIFMVILLFLGFSWLLKYPDIISSQALLTTEQPLQKEIAQQGGKITQLFVSNGQAVLKGQDLAVIENTANYKDVQYLKSIIDTLRFTKEAFYFPINNIPLLFLGDIDVGYANFENAYLAYDHNRRVTPFENTKRAQYVTSQELSFRLQTLYNQKELQQSELIFQEKDLKRYEQLWVKGVISQQEYEQQQLQYLQAQRSFKNLNATISQTKEQIGISQSSYEIEKSTNTSEQIRLFRNTIQAFNQLKKAVYDWEAQYVLRAEMQGAVTFLEYWSVNQEVGVGDLLFNVIPEDGKGHIAKLTVPARNSGKLEKGQRVLLNLDNYPEATYGKLESTLSHISEIPDSDGNYVVDVQLPEKLITTYNKEIPFKTEMVAQAKIITEDLRLIERFFYQIRGIFNQ